MEKKKIGNKYISKDVERRKKKQSKKLLFEFDVFIFSLFEKKTLRRGFLCPVLTHSLP